MKALVLKSQDTNKGKSGHYETVLDHFKMFFAWEQIYVPHSLSQASPYVQCWIKSSGCFHWERVPIIKKLFLLLIRNLTTWNIYLLNLGDTQNIQVILLPTSCKYWKAVVFLLDAFLFRINISRSISHVWMKTENPTQTGLSKKMLHQLTQ